MVEVVRSLADALGSSCHTELVVSTLPYSWPYTCVAVSDGWVEMTLDSLTLMIGGWPLTPATRKLCSMTTYKTENVMFELRTQYDSVPLHRPVRFHMGLVEGR